MKKLQGMKNNFSSFENKKLSNLASILGGTGAPTNETWTRPSTDEWNCADIDHYVDGVFNQRQTSTENAGTPLPMKSSIISSQ